MNNYKKIATLETHNNVQMITALSDGRIVSCGQTIDIWKEVNGKWRLADIVEQTINWIYSVIQLRDGRLVSGGREGTIKIWKEVDGKWRCENTIDAHKASINKIIQLKDGRLVSVSDDKTLKIWEEKDGDWYLSTRHWHKYPVNTVIDLQDGRIAIVGKGKGIEIIPTWSTCEGLTPSDFMHVHTIDVNSEVMSLIQLRDGRLVLGTADGDITIYYLNKEYRTWYRYRTIIGHSDWIHSLHSDCIYSLQELSDGRLVSGSYDKTIKIWREVEGDWICEQTLLNDGDVFTAIAIKDGQFLICGSGSSINIWEIEKPLETEKPIEKEELTQIGNGLSSKTIGNSTVIFDKDTNIIAEIICNQEIIYKYNVDIKDKDFNIE